MLCAIGIVATLARGAVTAACVLGGPAAVVVASGPVMFFVTLLCVYQTGSLARISFAPLQPVEDKASEHGAGIDQRAMSSWSLLFGDLRVYSGTTVICELLVIVAIAGGLFHSSHESEGEESDRVVSDDSTLFVPINRFVLSQAALSLVLLRLYTAWLAYNVHKLRMELIHVVLPQSPKAHEVEVEKLKLKCKQSKLDGLAVAWDAPPIEEGPYAPRPWQQFLVGTRARALALSLGTILLVVAAATVGIWRAHQRQAKAAPSTCRTATAGLDFCVEKHVIGGSFHLVTTFEHCCKWCDATKGCQAWTFQGGTGECYLLRFDSAHCRKQPNHKDCLCNTGIERMSGFSLAGDTSTS
jgi:hypothetical protein